MVRADLDGNGELDYAEYERVMNMQKFGDAQGGNLYVRNAINLGLLHYKCSLDGVRPACYQTNGNL